MGKRPTKLRLRAPKLTAGWGREDVPEFDMRSFIMMRKIFDHDPNAKKVTVTQKMMAHAKKVVTAELLRQRALSTTKGGAPLEHAFYIATGEPTLFFDYALMLKMVRDCELVELTREMDPDYLDAYATTSVRVQNPHEQANKDVSGRSSHDAHARGSALHGRAPRTPVSCCPINGRGTSRYGSARRSRLHRGAVVVAPQARQSLRQTGPPEERWHPSLRGLVVWSYRGLR